jgi:hypothetical protein
LRLYGTGTGISNENEAYRVPQANYPVECEKKTDLFHPEKNLIQVCGSCWELGYLQVMKFWAKYIYIWILLESEMC